MSYLSKRKTREVFEEDLLVVIDAQEALRKTNSSEIHAELNANASEIKEEFTSKWAPPATDLSEYEDDGMCGCCGCPSSVGHADDCFFV